MVTLYLEVDDYKDAHHWYWRLKNAKGKLLADHEVALDPKAPEYDAFLNLPRHLEIHADPYRRAESEAQIVARLGEWMGKNFYGPIADKILAAGTPAMVHVTVPDVATGLLYVPWELAHVGGKPLALQDVTLVFDEPGQTSAVEHAGVGESLRILAVFSLPIDASALNLRQERYELARTIRSIASEQGRAIDLRVLQYGVTRESLKQVLREGEGWDMVHFSGHGLAAHLALEKPDGTLDLVPSHELADLLKPAREGLKWVSLSACLSAAATVEETRLWLGLKPSNGTAAPSPKASALQMLARALVQKLDCAVLAMRYPVADQFSIDLGHGLFRGVLEQGQSLVQALQLTLPEAIQHPDAGAAAVATPALFGKYAAQVELSAPVGEAPLHLAMSYFPPEPERFVGRVGLLSQARGAMVRGSTHRGVLFYGMSGAGKTTCALELAYQYFDVERFQRFVWYSAPKEDDDIAGALGRFAQQWDIQVDAPELPMVAMNNTDDATFAALLPRLSTFLGQRSVMVVLDNVESLLRPNGQWRDPRWEKLLAALLNHKGPSRVILTSRIHPMPADARLLDLPVHSLTLNETALLARQSPNLGRLLRDPDHRPLAIEALKLVQGHPKLLELAEAQAASAEVLDGHLKRARDTETELEAFFQTGQSTLDGDGFLKALHIWTKSVVATLSGEARTLFHRLCCMEEEDREEWIIRSVWSDVSASATELMTAALMDAKYRIHPGVAEAGREEAGGSVRDAVDATMSGAWWTTYFDALKKEAEGMGGMVLRSAQSAIPYLMRQRRWQEAQGLLERVIQRDASPATMAEVLPVLYRIVELTSNTAIGLRSTAILARALSTVGRNDEAREWMQNLEQQAARLEDFPLAASIAGDLANLMAEAGHFEAALAVLERLSQHNRYRKLGPWTQLSAEVRRLTILSQLGKNEEVLAEVTLRLEEVRGWPTSVGDDETVAAWNVMEVLLGTGLQTAALLERWETSLSLCRDAVEVTTRRGATPLEVARIRYNTSLPLIRLRRFDQAAEVLHDCLSVFESSGGDEELGNVQSAIADLEDELGHWAEALRHESAALRYRYSGGSPYPCSISHFNLARYLKETNADVRSTVAHRLASIVILYQTNSGLLPKALGGVRTYLADAQPGDIPATFDEVCVTVEQIEGVRFRQLFARLPKRAVTGDEALQAVLALVREQSNPTPPVSADSAAS